MVLVYSFLRNYDIYYQHFLRKYIKYLNPPPHPPKHKFYFCLQIVGLIHFEA